MSNQSTTAPDSVNSPLTFSQLRQANLARYEALDEKDWSLLEWGGALAGEVGELCNLLKKMRRGDMIRRQAVADEIADVMIQLDVLAHRCQIDLGEAVRKKFNEVSRRRGINVFLPEVLR